LGGELVLVSACKTVTPLITDGPEHTHTHASSAGYRMNDVNIVDISLRIIKQCGMYGKEYKAWIALETVRSRIIEMNDRFKTFLATKITLVNQTTIPASMHGYGMAAVNNNDSVIGSQLQTLGLCMPPRKNR
jgi:hypothetical protein